MPTRPFSLIPPFLLALVLSFTATTSPAAAHGRFPETGQIAFHPTNPMHIAVRTTFGMLISADGGDTWRWVCREVLNISLAEDPFLTLSGDGSLLVATFDGLFRSDDDACSWGFPSEVLESEITFHLISDPSDPAISLVVTSPGSRPNQVFRTTDHGATWAPTAEPVAEAGFLSERIAIAPSDPDRLYVSGSHLPTETDPRQPTLYRSDNGGASWTPHPVALEEGERNIFLMAVHPTNPDRLFVRVSRERDDPGQERLIRSDDGGQTWTSVLTMDALRGVVFDETGARSWVGGWDETAPLRISEDGGESFTSLENNLSIGCLAWRGGELWACTQNFTDGFALARSTDGGESFAPRMVFQTDIVGLVNCAADSPTVTSCTSALEDLTNDLALAMGGDFPDGGVLSGSPDAGIDAGVGTPMPGNEGCGCHVGAARFPSSTGGLLLLVGILWFRRRTPLAS